MSEPTYRWVCTYCDAFGEAESSEMARLAVDVHVSFAHAHAVEPDGGAGQDDGPESSRTGGAA
jgi:hypothetical protein